MRLKTYIAWGYTEEAIRHKIKSGEWVEGREWIKAPDGRIHLNPRAIDAWVETGK